ncbi:MAG: S16 family serine protease [Betaproteobacteria bacterium]
MDRPGVCARWPPPTEFRGDHLTGRGSGRSSGCGAVKEKVLAALRSGIKTVLLPRKNAKDVEDVPADARAA